MNESELPDYKRLNKELWNNKTEVHYNSDFYDNENFIKGKSSLNSIELELLGDVRGKKILHLQCHFGQDSISLARLGAEVTGIDLSDKAIGKAIELAEITGTSDQCTFVESDVYELPNVLEDSFDIVFTSYGTVTWLPDTDKWAGVIAHYLKPGGQFVFAEFHPVVWMFNEDFDDVGYNYFNAGPIFETEEGTYTDRDADLRQDFIGWNHNMAEVITSLLNQNLRLDVLQEFDYSPYDCFAHTEEFEKGKYRIKHQENNIPLVYAIKATNQG
jgi:ubiquinone/menaquinone biosynthesis C-methylase UbiE